ncbi:MAG: glycosyltransferase family 4 protein [Bryobacteraceae bacterium]|nr:glycosyltransferase family 4 protein [Bryobacteraceae bacterium]
MPVRIAIDCRHIKDFGVGTYIRNLTRSLARLDRQDRFLLIAHRKDLHDFAGFPENFELVAYDRADSQLLDNIAFPLFLRGLGADLFHIPRYQAPLWMPRPYIVTVHDLSDFAYEAVAGWRAQTRRLKVRRTLLRADMVIAVSSATRRDVEDVLAVPPEKIRRIYNAPDPRFIGQVTAADARAAGPNAAERYRQRILERYQIHYPFILYVGNIRPQKNVPRLVEAFALLKGELAGHPAWSDLRLLIIGDEISRFPSVRVSVMQSRVENAVRFLGFVPIDTLRAFYQAAAVFAFPSLYEGFGLPPLEAMASGTPVVTSSVSSLPEVVGDAAVVVNPESVFDIERGLRDILLNEDLRERLIERGYCQVKRFSWEQNAADVLKIYHSVARLRTTVA